MSKEQYQIKPDQAKPKLDTSTWPLLLKVHIQLELRKAQRQMLQFYSHPMWKLTIGQTNRRPCQVWCHQFG
jgi:hypothetical protein